MPRATFTPENKGSERSGFPKIKLEQGEKARIGTIEKSPLYEWVHQLRAPAIVGGVIQYETVQGKNNGPSEQRVKNDFIGNPLCLGDQDILAANGYDPKNCPACAEADKSGFVGKPSRRFAMHVLHYATKPGGFEPQTPYQVNIEVWAFGDPQFNKLIDMEMEWAPTGGLATHDLKMDCKSKAFQTYDIQVASEALWRLNEQIQQFTLNVYRDNQCPDLSEFCGRKSDKNFVIQDVQRVVERMRVYNQILNGGAAFGVETTLTQTVDSGIAPTPGLDFSTLIPSTAPAPAIVVPDLATLMAQTPVAAPVAPVAAPLDMAALLAQTAAPQPVEVLTVSTSAPASPLSAETVPQPPPAVPDAAPTPAAAPVDATALLAGASTPAPPVATVTVAPTQAATTPLSLEQLLARLGG